MSDDKFYNQRNMPFKAKQAPALSVGDFTHKPATEQRGSDPYNTSGSFDRKKNWERVGKR